MKTKWFKLFEARTSMLAVLTLATLVAGGCESDPARQRSNKALATITDTRAEFVAGKADVEKALQNLGKLQARPANLTPAYKDFKGSVATIERRADTVGNRVRDMRVRADSYSTAWSADNQSLSDPELRDLADARVERVSAQYEKANISAQEVRAAYEPFIQQLRDVEQFLSNDLTYNGIQAAGPAFDSARDRGYELIGKIDRLIGDLDATEARLSPTTRTSSR